MKSTSTLLIFFLTILFSCSNSDQIEVVKFDRLESLMENTSNQIRVINFWATWCKPCVKEIPNFEEANKQDGVEVILVSLDFADELDKVKRFATKKELKSNVILLDEIDYNSWIDQVDNSWSGAIPATVIIAPQATRKKFIEGELSADELDKAISEFQ